LAQQKLSQAEKYLLMSLDICRQGGNVIFELWVLPALCELYLRSGDVSKAKDCSNNGFKLLKADRQWFGLPGAMFLTQAMIDVKVNDWKAAQQSFEKAVEISRQYELVWDEAKANLEIAHMQLAKSQADSKERAQESLAAAKDLFRKAGAQKDYEMALGTLNQL
jgi:hypothetical protein